MSFLKKGILFIFAILILTPFSVFASHNGTLGQGSEYGHGHEDEILTSLPGLDYEVNFKHYSGYLQTTETHFLHYWFVTSQHNPDKDPLIFWFNGGPGCSSIDGLLSEMGPYLVDEDGETLKHNPHAWNKRASIVYIESPVGVGYSYTSNGVYPGNPRSSDEVSATTSASSDGISESSPETASTTTTTSTSTTSFSSSTDSVTKERKSTDASTSISSSSTNSVTTESTSTYAPTSTKNSSSTTDGITQNTSTDASTSSNSSSTDYETTESSTSTNATKSTSTNFSSTTEDITNESTSTDFLTSTTNSATTSDAVSERTSTGVPSSATSSSDNVNSTPFSSSHDVLTAKLPTSTRHPKIYPHRRRLNWNNSSSILIDDENPSSNIKDSIVINDDSTSLENYEALKQFFRKFPAFRRHRVFIAGESYAGIYIPTLVERVLDGRSEFPINLEGMIIGNGLLNEALNQATLVEFAYGHGLIGEKRIQQLEKECAKNCTSDECDKKCARRVSAIHDFCWTGGLNPYDLYRNCDPIPRNNSFKMRALERGILQNLFYSGYRTNSNNDHKTKSMYGHAICLDDTAITRYMNNPQVREALHIAPLEVVPSWEICSDLISRIYKPQHKDMTDQMKRALRENLRVLLFYGDTDMVCNFLMGQRFASQLGLEPVAPARPWHFDGQIGGFKTVYKTGINKSALTYITVRGAGHMAAQWRAAEMSYALRQFLADKQI